MDDTQSQPPAAWWAELDALRADYEQLRRDVIASEIHDDGEADIGELRTTELEEIVAARWPRRILVRWRLARDIRRSVAHIELDTFTARRIESVGTGWVKRDTRPGNRRASERPPGWPPGQGSGGAHRGGRK